MRKFVCAAFNAWFIVVYLVALCAGQEVTVSDASIILKTVTNETQTSTIDGVELASTTRQVSSIESTQKVKRLDVASESKKISVIIIPFSPFQKIDDNSFLLLGKSGTYNVILTSFDEGWQSLAEVTIGDQPPPPPPPPGPIPVDEFDNIGQRVDAMIRTLPDATDREAFASELASIPAKMTSFEIKRMTDARAAIKALSSKWIKYKAASDLIGKDGSTRLLGWEEAIKYYTAVSVGIRGKAVTQAKSKPQWRQVCPGNGQPCYWVEVTQ